MAYNSLIPAANDLLSQSQSEIQENFAQIKTVIDINHITFADANQGKHLYLQLPEHAAPATAVNEAGLYANVGATSAVTELFFRRENNGSSIPMSEMVEISATNGWSYLPSGLIIQWGSASQSGGTSSSTFALPRAFPTTFYSITATPNNTPSGSHTDIIMATLVESLTHFRVKRKTNFGTACSFNFFAIGI